MARRMAKNRMAGGGQIVELVPILDRAPQRVRRLPLCDIVTAKRAGLLRGKLRHRRAARTRPISIDSHLPTGSFCVLAACRRRL